MLPKLCQLALVVSVVANTIGLLAQEQTRVQPDTSSSSSKSEGQPQEFDQASLEFPTHIKELLSQRDELRGQFTEANRPDTLGKAKEVIEQILAIELQLVEWLDAQQALGSQQLSSPDLQSLLSTFKWLVNYLIDHEEFSDAIDAQRKLVLLTNRVLAQGHYLIVDSQLKLSEIERYSQLSSEDREQLNQAGRLNHEALKLSNANQFAEAETSVREVLATREAYMGQYNTQVLSDLENLAYLLEAQGKIGEYVSVLRDEKTRRLKTQGASHPAFSLSLARLDKALTLLVNREQAAKDFVAAQQANNELIDLCLIYYGQNDFRTKDARLAAEHIRRLASLSPEEHAQLELVSDLRAQASKAFADRRFADCVEPASKALEILEILFGRESRDYSGRLNELAALYAKLGDYARAESAFDQAMQIRKRVHGELHPLYMASLEDLAGLYRVRGDYAREALLQTQAIQIIKQVLGEQHPDYVSRLNTLANIYKSLRDFAQAEPLFVQAMQINKQTYGEQHPAFALSLYNLARLYNEMGDPARAKLLCTQAIRIQEQTLGKQHPDYATSLSTLADVYLGEGNYTLAESLYTQTTQIYKQVLGEQHPDYAVSLNNLARVYAELGDYTRAELLFTQALEIRRQVLGEHHPEYATSLRDLGRVYTSMGDYPRAEQLLLKALEITKQRPGEQRSGDANSLNNLATLYFFMGDYARAESLYTQDLEDLKQTLGELHPHYATRLNNLALLYDHLGDYARAEVLYTQALHIDKLVYGELSPKYAVCLNNLGGMYTLMEDYGRAEPLLQQALEINRQLLGEQHLDYAKTLNNMALLYNQRGETARAEPLCIQALAITKQVLGEQHPSYANGLNNLASLYHKTGDFARAEPLYTQALQISKLALGEQHPDYAVCLVVLAGLYAYTQRFDEAFLLYEQALAITRKHLDDTAYVLSERQQLTMNQSRRNKLDSYLQACLAAPSIPPEAVVQVMLWKGSVLYRLKELRIAAEDPTISDQFKQLQRAAAGLSKLTQAIPEPDQAANWKERVAKLTAEKEILEAELMRSSAAFREAVQQVTFDQIQRSIPENGVLVDYLEFSGYEGRSLLASIVTRNADPVMIALGSATDVSQAIDVWRETFGMSPQAKSAGLKLRKQIWEPVLEHLGSAETILVSTDGVLGRLPFAALPGKAPGTYLIEDHRLALIPVPQLLPALVHEQESKNLQHELLLIGDVNYDEVAGQDSSQAAELNAPRKRPWERNALPQAVRGETHWNALSETRAEVEFIAGLYNRLYQPGPEAVLDLRQTDASETAFRTYAPQSVFLHLATHGFFAAPDKQSAMSAELVAQRSEERAGRFQQLRDVVRGYSPGQLSGIVFAGANRKPDSSLDALNDETGPSDDGIMTADEIAFMRLEGVRLVVLSACETGLGEVAGGEGLLGIQRGFQMAGAHSTVASLWKVNDAATRRLMQEFYTNYLDKELSMIDALRETQLWALNHPGDVPRGAIRDKSEEESTRLPPQFWAPFVLSGDWR